MGRRTQHSGGGGAAAQRQRSSSGAAVTATPSPLFVPIGSSQDTHLLELGDLLVDRVELLLGLLHGEARCAVCVDIEGRRKRMAAEQNSERSHNSSD